MELPEVEIVRQQMEQVLLGKEITTAWGHNSKRFLAAKKSAGHTIKKIDRHGKYLLIKMVEPFELICHLGMSGSLNIRKCLPADLTATSADLNTRSKKYIRARWFFNKNKPKELMELRDVRRFGWVFWVKSGDYKNIPTLNNSGPDGLSPDFTATTLHQALQKSNSNIKYQLLSQKPVAGLGNIYINEALWHSNISPKRTQFSFKQSEELHLAIVASFKAGLKHGGTTLRDYRNFSGTKGSHQNHLFCYGKGGEPCLKCKHPLTQIKLDGRGTTYCKYCQK